MESNNKTCYTVVWLGTPLSSFEQEKNLNEGEAIKHILYFDDKDIHQCLKCIQITSTENILLVITGTASDKIVLDENILASIHNLPQVKIIYVDAKYSNRHPSSLFCKMRYISTASVPLHIQADLHGYAHFEEPFVFETFDERSSLAMNGDFIHFQMLIDSSVDHHTGSNPLDNYYTFVQGKNDFMEVCKDIYKNDAIRLAEAQKFEQTYSPEKAVHCYSENSFLYYLINRALRTNDTQLILAVRFLIIDIHKQLAEKIGEPFTEENELNSLRKSLGNIISMKSFLSTSLDRHLASFFWGNTTDSGAY